MGINADVKYALRSMAGNYGFVLAAVAALALGIAANTTVFSIANALILKGPPFPEADRIMHVYEFDRTEGASPRGGSMSYPDFLEFAVQNQSFTALAGYAIGTYNISDEVSAPERVEGSLVTPNLFRLLGYGPILGRDFSSGEEQPGASPVVIISHGLWQSRYGGDPNIIGRTLRSNAAPHTIVGVMPEGIKFPVRSEIWLPLGPASAAADRAFGGFDVIGRLRDGVGIEQVRADARLVAARLRIDYPESNAGIDANVIPLAQRYGSPNDGVVLTALFGGVGFVLLIVCANLASLLLARATLRVRDTAIRIAIGAGRWQVTRQFLTEGVTLSFLGGFLGLALAVPAVRLVAGEMANVGLPYWVVFEIDYRVAFQLVAVCVLVGVLLGLAPAFQAARADVQTQLIGQRVQLGDSPDALSATIVGVAANLEMPDDGTAAPLVYIPYRQEPLNQIVLITPSSLDRDAVVRSLRFAVQNLDADLPIFNVRTVDEFLWRLSVGNRVLGALFSAFAAIALVIAIVGVYGVTAYAASRRIHEIGVRMALGAGSGSIMWLVMRRAVWQAAIGLAIGGLGAWAVSRIVLSQVIAGLPGQASANDPMMVVAVAMLIAITMVTACWIPALRATRTDPASSLRAF